MSLYSIFNHNGEPVLAIGIIPVTCWSTGAVHIVMDILCRYYIVIINIFLRLYQSTTVDDMNRTCTSAGYCSYSDSLLNRSYNASQSYRISNRSYSMVTPVPIWCVYMFAVCCFFRVHNYKRKTILVGTGRPTGIPVSRTTASVPSNFEPYSVILIKEVTGTVLLLYRYWATDITGTIVYPRPVQLRIY